MSAEHREMEHREMEQQINEILDRYGLKCQGPETSIKNDLAVLALIDWYRMRHELDTPLRYGNGPSRDDLRKILDDSHVGGFVVCDLLLDRIMRWARGKPVCDHLCYVATTDIVASGSKFKLIQQRPDDCPRCKP